MDQIDASKVSARYIFGSKIYGTASPDSDTDLVIVLTEGTIKPFSKFEDGDYHYQVYTHEEWMYKVVNHDIQALECIFYENQWEVTQNYPYHEHFKLDLNRLRESISTIANNSWVKGKKKLIVSGDYDKKQE